jgi:hypothetical protein
MSYEPEDYGPEQEPHGPRHDREAARGKVMVPGVLLIISAVINVFFSLFLLGTGALIATKTPEQMRAQQEMTRKILPSLPEQDPSQLKTISMAEYLGGGLVDLLATLVMIVGGIQMIRLRTFGLAVVAAILALLPCISCAGCFGLGQLAGIWALVVLAKPEVKESFL